MNYATTCSKDKRINCKKDVIMINASELEGPAGSFEQRFHDPDLLIKIGEDMKKKGGRPKLQSELEKLKKINFIDCTTGIYNKRYLRARFEIEIARAQKYGFPLSLIFIDLDNYKTVDDTCGHAVGNRLLGELAGILRRLCRDEEVLARFGEEEFVILMSCANSSRVVEFAEIIGEKVEGHFLVYNDIEVPMSVSLGVTTLNNDDFEYVKGAEELIFMADRALSNVKQNGRENNLLFTLKF